MRFILLHKYYHEYNLTFVFSKTRIKTFSNKSVKKIRNDILHTHNTHHHHKHTRASQT